jgi:hypothetical protein
VQGLACCLDLDKTFAFFAQRDRLKGTTAFLGGIVTVLLGWPILGMIIELYGFVALFGGFLPLVISFLRQVTSLCPSVHDIYRSNVSGPGSYSSRDSVTRFFASVFFHESPCPRPLKITLGSFRIFSKIGEIFVSQGAPPVSTTPVAN